MKQISKMIEAYQSLIKETTTNKNQFEMNVKSEFMVKELSDRLDFIEFQRNYIGKEVFRYKNNISVISMKDYMEKNDKETTHSLFNPIEEDAIIYSESDFHIFLKKYLSFTIEKLKDKIIQQPFVNSTNPFTNLENQWIVDCRKKLVELLIELEDEYVV